MSVQLGTSGEPLSRRIALLIGARLLFLTALLGLLVLLYGRSPFEEFGFTAQAAAVTLAVGYGAAGVYALWLRSGRRTQLLADSQLVVDQLTWTAIVYLSGGAASGATSFYGLTCLAGATLAGLRGAGIAAVAACLSYLGLVVTLARGWLPSPPDQPLGVYVLTRTESVYYVAVNLLVLVVVTLLAGYLAERLRLTGGQLRQAEQRAEQAERMAALGRLAAGLAHEIRNPLGSISGSIQLLKTSSALSEEDQQLCEIIHRESARLNDLVTDMMDLSRPRKPSMVLMDAAVLAKEVVDLASRSGRAVSDVAVSYRGPEHAFTRGDASQIRQMLWNLIRNAVQASSAGDSVAVSVLVSEGQVVLSVEDHGIGISDDAKSRIFDAFFTTRSKGTGVGLAVVKQIVDDHGYSIEVASERGEGALFRVLMGAEEELRSED